MSKLIKIPYHISELSCGNKATRMGRQQGHYTLGQLPEDVQGFVQDQSRQGPDEGGQKDWDCRGLQEQPHPPPAGPDTLLFRRNLTGSQGRPAQSTRGKHSHPGNIQTNHLHGHRSQTRQI